MCNVRERVIRAIHVFGLSNAVPHVFTTLILTHLVTSCWKKGGCLNLQVYKFATVILCCITHFTSCIYFLVDNLSGRTERRTWICNSWAIPRMKMKKSSNHRRPQRNVQTTFWVTQREQTPQLPSRNFYKNEWKTKLKPGKDLMSLKCSFEWQGNVTISFADYV